MVLLAALVRERLFCNLACAGSKLKFAEIIAIGDEMTSGARLDTNSQWITQQLSLLGIETLYHTTVGDDLTRKTDVFRQAAERVELVVCTGGLGPTADDLTRQVVADLAGVNLVFDEASMRHIESLFARRGRIMRESNRIQAYVPEGALVIPNPQGTAPGFEIDLGYRDQTATLVALPGVPAELKEMFAQTVTARLLEKISGRRFIRQRSIHCFGSGESEIEQRLPGLVQRGRSPRVGITASKATITLRICAVADSEAECEKQIHETQATIREHLGELVFGFDDQQLEDVVCQLLRERKQSIGIYDFLSAGNIGQLLLDAEDPLDGKQRSVLGCRAFPRGSELARQRQEFPDTPCTDSTEALTAWARLAQRDFNASIGLAISAPADRSDERGEAPLVIVRGGGPAECFGLPYSGHPSIRQPRCIKAAFNQLRLLLGS